MTTRSERLQSTRARIAVIRTILADETLMTNVSVSGVSETIDRDALRRELKELEADEDRLSGHCRRLRTIDMTGA